MKQGTIIVVDDNKSILTAAEMLLSEHFSKVITVNNPNALPATLRDNPMVDIILLDMNFKAGINTGNEGFYWLNKIKEFDSTISVVFFTAYGDIELAVRGIKEGASDFVVKPWDNNRLVATLQNAMALRSSRKQIRNMKASKSPEPQMQWGTSEKMRSLRHMVERVAKTDANILITGENGTGKEMLAREIHNLSHRRDSLLMSVDMGAVTESLFESELFGHVKGAFTDAKSDRAGKFEVADTGTLFLDEIGNLPYHLQAKLLVALQSRHITRVGSNTPINVDIRLIAATNRNLEQMVADNLFREDLLYRMNTITLEIPPLRERPEDIMPLAKIFLERYAAKYGKRCNEIEPKAAEKITSAYWAGNIRELQHTIEKAVIMSNTELLKADDFLITRNESSSSSTSQNKIVTLEDMERNMIQAAMDQNGGNLSVVADKLGITRQTLYNKIKRYGI